ncbi:putative DNA polymerase [Trachymyrmex zeteki]|uniref:DNA-directed DNA polymerase n=1 Tax=Mycetomoellerius zeteki TaxID=64791 RepID=A0A151WR76_9HYME|nr:putative DNA polymerase [Trachymyrmex zeteki]
MYYEGERHYRPILNLKAAAGSRGGYCIPCNIGYCEERGHRCSNKCPRCNNVPSCEQLEVNVISVIQFCENCGRVINITKEHECGVSFCKICSSLKPRNHLCFMQPLSREGRSSDDESVGDSPAIVRENECDNTNASDQEHQKGRTASVFYDCETRQNESMNGTEIKIHVPTLCIAQQICDSCAEVHDLSQHCRWCGAHEFVFRRDPVGEFVECVTRPTKNFTRIICIAHNAKAFDAQFIFRFIVGNHSGLEPKVILNGTKIIVLTVGRTKFIDSINYMPMRLSELPKAFGLPDTCDKGIFPHLFNIRENQTYVGPLPDVDYYAPETMQPEERERFLAWHAEMTRQNTVFDFQREIVTYCRTDVNILRRACLSFRKIFLEHGNVCPFAECTTIASTCMRVFRKNFLRKEEIDIIPTGGYRMNDNQLTEGMLILKEREIGRRIIHAGHGREYRLTEGMLVDGYYECENAGETQRYVLQFHGCFFHGCPTCYRINRDEKIGQNSKDTLDARYERTIATTWRVRCGHIVMEKWECAFDEEMHADREVREFVEKHPMIQIAPLDPRDAFFGERTGNIVTRYAVEGNEKIRYVDVCSLYPYILKTGVFPIKHPDIFVGDECSVLIGEAPNFNFDRVTGLVRCCVLPPRDLFHPVSHPWEIIILALSHMLRNIFSICLRSRRTIGT